MCCWNSSAAHRLMDIISGHPMQSRSRGRLAYSWKYPNYFKASASFTYGLISGAWSDVWSDVQHVTNMILLYHLMTRVLTQRNLWAYRVTLRSRRSISECAPLVTTYCRSHLFSADRQEKAISRCQTDNMLKSSTGVEQAPLAWWESGHKHGLRWSEKGMYHVIGNSTAWECQHYKRSHMLFT